jgi:hypothetical protein
MKTTPQKHFVLLLYFIQMTLVCGSAQVRTVTQQPYPTEANSVAWIANMPYISGAGAQQQLDLFVATNRNINQLSVNAGSALAGSDRGLQGRNSLA